MTATGTVYVENVADALAGTGTFSTAYTSVKVYRDTSVSGLFTTLATTLTLVSGTLTYSFTDSGGNVSSLYRCTFYNTGTTAESGFGDIIRPGATLASFRRDCARLARAGSSSTCTALGTTTTLIDAALAMSGVDAYYHEGDWLYRPSAGTATDCLRRVGEAGFATSTGTLSIPAAYPWAVAPALNEAYDIYQLFPPVEVGGEAYSWNDGVRDGIRNTWFMDQVNVGLATSTGQTRYSLSAYANLITRDSVYDVLYRSTDTNGIIHDRQLGGSGTYWTVQENDTDGLTLIVSDPPRYSTATTSIESVILSVKRRYPMPYTDSDVINGPLGLATAATLRNVFLKIEGERGPRFIEWQQKYREEYRIHGARARLLV